MMKSSVFVIVFLAFVATVQCENELRDLIKPWIGGGSNVNKGRCKWGKGDEYPIFQLGSTIEVLDGCYRCKFAEDCKFTCERSAKKGDCDKSRAGAVCQWAGTGLPKIMPREDVYRDDTHVCELSVKGCELMCWNAASENAKRLLDLLLEEKEVQVDRCYVGQWYNVGSTWNDNMYGRDFLCECIANNQYKCDPVTTKRELLEERLLNLLEGKDVEKRANGCLIDGETIPPLGTFTKQNQDEDKERNCQCLNSKGSYRCAAPGFPLVLVNEVQNRLLELLKSKTEDKRELSELLELLSEA